MAGARQLFEVRDLNPRLQNTLRHLQRELTDMKPVFTDIGEYLMERGEKRFEEQVDPDGVPWAPLTDATKAMKKMNSDCILFYRGYLRESMHYNVHDHGLMYGTNLPQGAMLNYGGITSPKSMIPGKTIVARPFVGLSHDDEDHIVEMLGRHYGDIIRDRSD
jgi:phage virion morphogenesis protein